jgi:mRNA interferase MazF
MRRGDLLTVALQGDLGKRRPALLVQSDLFDMHPSVAVLPVTSDLANAPLFRIALQPSAGNGLQRPPQVMVDKPQSVQRQRLGPVFGRVDDETMVRPRYGRLPRPGLSAMPAGRARHRRPARVGYAVIRSSSARPS